MTETPDVELAEQEADKEEIAGYIRRFVAAFNELHAAAVVTAQSAGRLLSPHHDYPQMVVQGNQFPSFYETGFFSTNGPKD